MWGSTNQTGQAQRADGTSSCEITVEGTRFTEVLAKYGMPYYLKIDIEGSDLSVRIMREKISSRDQMPLAGVR